MRSFEDFLDSFGGEEIQAIVNDSNLKADEIRSRMSPKDPAYQGTQIGVISYTIAIELLGLYHKWLSQEDQNL